MLVETTDESRARKLMELAQHPAVIGSRKRSALFWFIISPVFAAAAESRNRQQGTMYLTRPEAVLDKLWALPEMTLHALGDTEN